MKPYSPSRLWLLQAAESGLCAYRWRASDACRLSRAVIPTLLPEERGTPLLLLVCWSTMWFDVDGDGNSFKEILASTSAFIELLTSASAWKLLMQDCRLG